MKHSHCIVGVTARALLLVACLCSGSVFALTPLEQRAKDLEVQAAGARRDAQVACNADAKSKKCMDMRSEYQSILGTQAAIQDVLDEGMPSGFGDSSQQAIWTQKLDEQEKLVKSNCRSSVYFAECQAHLDELDRTNAYLKTYESLTNPASTDAQVTAAQAEMDTYISQSTAVAMQAPAAQNQRIACDENVYGTACTKSISFIDTSSKTLYCGKVSPDERCRKVKGDLGVIAVDMKRDMERERLSSSSTASAPAFTR